MMPVPKPEITEQWQLIEWIAHLLHNNGFRDVVQYRWNREDTYHADGTKTIAQEKYLVIRLDNREWVEIHATDSEEN